MSGLGVLTQMVQDARETVRVSLFTIGVEICQWAAKLSSHSRAVHFHPRCVTNVWEHISKTRVTNTVGVPYHTRVRFSQIVWMSCPPWTLGSI